MVAVGVVVEFFGTGAGFGAGDEGLLDVAEVGGGGWGEVVIADAFEGREFEEGLAVGVEEAAVGFPVAWVVGDVDEVSGDEDGAGVADFAAEWEVLVR